jgi:putative transposase
VETYKISEEASLYYLTFSILEWMPVFVSEAPCLIVTESLNTCHRDKGLRINAFAVMPTHLHLIVFDADFDSNRLKATLTSFRKYTGQRLIAHCRDHMPRAFAQTFAATQRSDRQYQFWQQSKHPEALWSQPMWLQKANYLHDNPRRKGLVLLAVDWRFSSAAFWLEDPRGDSDVALSAVEW